MIAEPENLGEASENLGEDSEFLGGQGGKPEKPATRADMVLYRRAMRNDYPVDERIRRLIVDQCAKIAENSDNEREVIAAARTLILADSVNVRREAMDQADEHKAQPDLVDVNVHSQILEDPDFYGNYDQLAKIAEASGVDPFASRPVQTDVVRPEVGENDGPAG